MRVRAAEDRAAAAEGVSLDMQRQCESAAGTISRLIDESNALISKLNSQAAAMGELRGEVAKRDAGIAALEGMLMQSSSYTRNHLAGGGQPASMGMAARKRQPQAPRRTAGRWVGRALWQSTS